MNTNEQPADEAVRLLDESQLLIPFSRERSFEETKNQARILIQRCIERATEADKDELAERLRIAWSKYQHFFSVPPHGTLKQIRAMLEFMPPQK